MNGALPLRAAKLQPRLVRRLPLATCLAVFLIILVEVSVRLIPVERLLPRPVSGPGVHTDTGQSSALAMIDARGSADVALIGSSIMKEAVDVPRMAETLRTRFHRRLTVGDYSVRGARAEEFHQIAHELLTSRRKPRVIIVGMSLRDMQVDGRGVEALAPYWQLDDWARAMWRRKEATAVRPLLWRSLSNTLSRHWRTVAVREQLRNLVLHPTRRLPAVETNPVTGNAGQNFRSLVAEGLVQVKEIRRMLARQSRSNSLAIDEPALDAIEKLVVEAQAEGVKVILMEMPIPRVMRKALPRAEYDQFLARTLELAAKVNVPFLQSRDFLKLNFPPKDGYFLDSQHMNSYGNTRFATILATVTARVMAPTSAPAASESR